MSIAPGTRLGPYEILGSLGAGGMGEVYTARDSRLERTVAIKVLPATVAHDPDARVRFEREARAVAALDHPHICAVYDIGRDAGIDFIVMQYLEGETLAARLDKGALPLDQVIRYAIEIADALDKAHRQGVVHRDLKPANIMLTKTGARLLDFGLARLQPAGGAIVGMSAVATEAPSLTAAGTILGTLQYMAPEQLEGGEADARTDIFALGAVIYEMATGRKAFAGKSQASVISAIMSAEPAPIATLQPTTPAALAHVVTTCLAKNPDERWQSARDIERELKWIADSRAEPHQSSTAVHAGSRGPVRSWIGGLIIGAAVAGVSVWTASRSHIAPTMPITRSTIGLAPGLMVTHPRSIALSADGRVVVFAGQDSGGSHLFLRPIDSFSATAIAGTDGAQWPFFSPDSRWIGFFQAGENKLKKIALSGGAPQTICETQSLGSAAWGDDGTIVFSTNTSTGLFSVQADGGRPRVLTKPDRAAGEKTHRGPDVLPGGKAVLFTVGTADITSFDDARIEALVLSSGQRKVLIRGGMNARYVATGHLIYARAGSLLAVPFDVNRVEVTGPPIPVITNVITRSDDGSAGYAISTQGSLLYAAGDATMPEHSLVWVDRNGRSQPAMDVRRNFRFTPRLTADARRVASTVDQATAEVWVYDLERTTGARVVHGWDNTNAVWSPDGNEIVFNSNRATPGSWNLFLQRVDGTAAAKQLTTSVELRETPQSWSPDGRYLVFTRESASGNVDIWMMAIADRATRALIHTPAAEANARISPDGKWLAYISNESGPFQVYVQAFPDPTRRWQVSLDGGMAPEWAPGGNELFYRKGPQMMAMTFSTRAEPALGHPIPLFEGDYAQLSTVGDSGYAVARDGRFLMITTDRQPITQLNLVENWFAELKAAVPAR